MSSEQQDSWELFVRVRLVRVRVNVNLYCCSVGQNVFFLSDFGCFCSLKTLNPMMRHL